jgi:hypothetical protein
MAGGLIAGGGIAGTLAALPMPLGSLTEPLRPRAFAGPGGMPLTPASWPNPVDGEARRQSRAKVGSAAPPNLDAQRKIETSCARLIDRRSLADFSERWSGGQRFDFFLVALDRRFAVFLAAFLVAAAFFTPLLRAFFRAFVTLLAPSLTEAGTRLAAAFFARLATDLTAVSANIPAARAARSVI